MSDNNHNAERHVCTPDDPWTPEKSKRADHPDAVELSQEDGYPGGDIVTYKCPNCGKRFKCELPQ